MAEKYRRIRGSQGAGCNFERRRFQELVGAILMSQQRLDFLASLSIVAASEIEIGLALGCGETERVYDDVFDLLPALVLTARHNAKYIRDTQKVELFFRVRN